MAADRARDFLSIPDYSRPELMKLFALAERWDHLDRVVAQPQRFTQEVQLALRSLAKRMKLEDTELHPLADTL